MMDESHLYNTVSTLHLTNIFVDIILNQSRNILALHKMNATVPFENEKFRSVCKSKYGYTYIYSYLPKNINKLR